VAGRVLVLPSQTPGLIERLGITRIAADSVAWAVEPAGTKFGGAAAVNRVLSELGGFWAIVAQAYRVPPFRWLEDRGYRWMADNRPRLARAGVTPECERPGVPCDGGQ
jgi:predicted DCC family thiol-disulfide oxidoreductase YuxK